VARLLAAPLLGSVTHLNAGGTPCGQRVAQTVSHSPWLDRLEVLTLGHGQASNVGACTLARATRLRALRRLTVSLWGIGPPGAAALAAAPWAGRLETLDLSFNPLTPAGWKALAPLVHGSLRRLGLARTRQGTSAVLSGLELPPHLVTLDLNANALDPAGLAALLPALTSLEQLADLRLDDNALGDEGARLLAASPVARRLRRLDLGRNGITEEGLGALLDALGPGRLTEFRLYNNDLGPAGLRLVDDWPARECLATLLVQGNNALEAEGELGHFWGSEM
jgi:Ran GTPase-activating protein (RanGAP) involved in mRNA processing and transport